MQADVRWTALSRALCSTGSPPQMVSILPGRCRGAPLEVDKLAGKHEDASIGEHGLTFSADSKSVWVSSHYRLWCRCGCRQAAEQRCSEHFSSVTAPAAAQGASHLRLHPAGGMRARAAPPLAACKS